MNLQKEGNFLNYVPETQNRGELTQRIKDKSVQLFGYEITQTELRLFPYIQYQLVNEKKLNPASVNAEDRRLLASYVEKGWVVSGVTKELGRPMVGEDFIITKYFWDKICGILWLGYVDLF